MARLIVETGDEAGFVYHLGAEPLLIGRGEDCGVRVADRRVSRHHAMVLRQNNSYYIEDLKSRNGTRVNHNLVSGRATLRNGDHIAVGGISFEFELTGEEVAEKSHQLSRVQLSPALRHQVSAERFVEQDRTPAMGATIPVGGGGLSDPMERLRVLYQVSDALRGEVNIDQLLWKVMELIWQVIVPDRGVILKSPEHPDEDMKPVVVKTAQDSGEEIVISQGIVQQCLQDRAAILMADSPSDERFADNLSVFSGRIRSVICVPLVAHGRPLGVVYVDTQYDTAPGGRNFTRDDLELMSGIANQAALALENARLHDEALRHQRTERELEIARSIQEQLLPGTFPVIPRVEFAAECRPARQVGGDYYDVFQAVDGRLAIVLGDAAGKGVPAAISVAMLRTAVRTRLLARGNVTLDGVTSDINNAICGDCLRDNFITLFIMLFNPATNEIAYVNAGHVAPVLARSSGEVLRLNEGGPLLGAIPGGEYTRTVIQLKPGDSVVMFSDGVTDTHNLRGDLYGDERLVSNVTHARTLSAERICESINEAVVGFRETREQFDDLTIVVLKLTDTGDTGGTNA